MNDSKSFKEMSDLADKAQALTTEALAHAQSSFLYGLVVGACGAAVVLFTLHALTK